MRVLIVGGKTSGRAAAHLLRGGGDEAVIYDTRPAPLGPLRDDGFRIHSGAWNSRLLDGVGLVVASPGVPVGATPIRDAFERGLPVWSEVELGFRRLGAPVIAVAGARGTRAIAALLRSMLAGSGIAAAAAGASPVAEDTLSSVALAAQQSGQEPDVAIAVVSGRDLRFIDLFRPGMVVLTDVDPSDDDAAALPNAFRNQGPADLVVHEDAPGAAAIAATAPARLVAVGAEARDAWPAVGGGDVDDATEVAMAATAAIEFGAVPTAVSSAIASRFDDPEPELAEAVG